MNYQWYPGHMTKAVRMMQENIKLIDLIIELVDARIPMSSRNPDIDELGRNKSRIVLLNKSDLADPVQNKKWMQYFEEQGAHALEVNSKSGAGVKSINGLVQEACKEKIERDRKRGIVNRPVRAMVVGIPNVGKSTFINSFAGKACAKTGNKPGVTKGKQWIRLNKSLELLDTPGILWPKFDDQEVGMRLAFIGSMNDEIIVQEELACDLIRVVMQLYPQVLAQRYGWEESWPEGDSGKQPQSLTEIEAAGLLERIAVSRNCFSKGEEPDLPRAAALLIDDFRSGRLGRMTLERR
ncbi:MAG: ribosome biogenesis GTPase YlqF [Acetatifactor sp.]|nr:ribosome biogenesis GTPase YlqF [Acetatifactor sp.]